MNEFDIHNYPPGYEPNGDTRILIGLIILIVLLLVWGFK